MLEQQFKTFYFSRAVCSTLFFVGRTMKWHITDGALALLFSIICALQARKLIKWFQSVKPVSDGLKKYLFLDTKNSDVFRLKLTRLAVEFTTKNVKVWAIYLQRLLRYSVMVTMGRLPNTVLTTNFQVYHFTLKKSQQKPYL